MHSTSYQLPDVLLTLTVREADCALTFLCTSVANITLLALNINPYMICIKFNAIDF